MTVITKQQRKTKPFPNLNKSLDINPLVKVVDMSYYNDYGFGCYHMLIFTVNAIELFDTKKPLFTHVRGEIPPHVKPEVDLDRFEDFPVVFAGDLHAHSNTQRNIVYPRSPMTTSFHRTEVQTDTFS